MIKKLFSKSKKFLNQLKITKILETIPHR